MSQWVLASRLIASKMPASLHTSVVKRLMGRTYFSVCNVGTSVAQQPDIEPSDLVGPKGGLRIRRANRFSPPEFQAVGTNQLDLRGLLDVLEMGPLFRIDQYPPEGVFKCLTLGENSFPRWIIKSKVKVEEAFDVDDERSAGNYGTCGH